METNKEKLIAKLPNEFSKYVESVEFGKLAEYIIKLNINGEIELGKCASLSDAVYWAKLVCRRVKRKNFICEHYHLTMEELNGILSENSNALVDLLRGANYYEVYGH